jgi:hypothetical protein
MKSLIKLKTFISSPYFDSPIERVAINAKMGSLGLATNSGSGEPATTMIAVSFGQKIRAMLFSESGNRIDVGTFDLNVAVDSLFFIGTQVSMSPLPFVADVTGAKQGRMFVPGEPRQPSKNPSRTHL